MCEDPSSLCLSSIDSSFAGQLFELALFLYAFVGLAIVCDQYLVASLETLCVRWNVREDVAGATFMAFGSAAPEILINSISTIKDDGSTDLGVGAIIGSGMIAFLVIPGLCGIVSHRPLLLKRRPLLRDAMTYTIALILLCVFFSDGVIVTWEAASLVGLYVIYLLFVFASPAIRSYVQDYRHRRHHYLTLRSALKEGASRETLMALKQKFLETRQKTSVNFVVANAPSDTSPNSEMNTSLLVYDHQQSNTDIDRQVLARLDPEEIMDDEEEEEADEQHRNTLMSFDEIETPEIPPTTCRRILNGIATIVTTPLEFIFRYTCIRCDHATVTAKWYPLTFLSAFIWVSWFSFLIATIVERWVVLSGVSLSFFGLVLVAVGAEIPDAVQSITCARRGYGVMAVSNSCGSQILNILIGLGLPWLIKDLRAEGVNDVEMYVKVTDHNSLQTAAFFQFANLILFIGLLLVAAIIHKEPKATLTYRKGIVFCCAYGVCLAGYALTVFV